MKFWYSDGSLEISHNRSIMQISPLFFKLFKATDFGIIRLELSLKPYMFISATGLIDDAYLTLGNIDPEHKAMARQRLKQMITTQYNIENIQGTMH